MNKEPFRTIFERHDLTIEGLAHEADVACSVVEDMLDLIPVAQGVATHVLATLSASTGITYTLSNVEIAVEPETPLQSEVARIIAEIDLQTEAMIRGLSGISQGSSRHAVITAKWEAVIGPYQERLEQANQANC
jgi:hypothetical protein